MTWFVDSHTKMLNHVFAYCFCQRHRGSWDHCAFHFHLWYVTNFLPITTYSTDGQHSTTLMVLNPGNHIHISLHHQIHDKFKPLQQTSECKSSSWGTWQQEAAQGRGWKVLYSCWVTVPHTAGEGEQAEPCSLRKIHLVTLTGGDGSGAQPNLGNIFTILQC